MTRPIKHPGLQPKFEAALQNILASEPLSGGAIQERLGPVAKQFEISPVELQDLRKNFVNYIGRAKTAGVISSGGPWSGYELNRPASPAGSGAAPTPTPDERTARQPTEAAMHLVATCALSLHFSARVLSLPTTVDSVAWGNADMLMLRGNPSRERLEGNKLDPEVLKLADSSPECILSSIELKYGLERNRRLWFLAVAEAAANSRWANESFLVHVTSGLPPEALDDEVVSLARSAEIGILEVVPLARDGRVSVETRVIVAAPQRPYLRLAELSGTRAGLLQEAHTLLKSWNENVVTFLDVDGAPGKLLQLLLQAVQNLRRQPGFGNRALKDALGTIVGPTVPSLFAAALDTATSTTDAGPTLASARDALTEVGSNTLTKSQWDAFLADLEAVLDFAARHGAA
jgi:hypothetical protein